MLRIALYDKELYILLFLFYLASTIIQLYIPIYVSSIFDSMNYGIDKTILFTIVMIFFGRFICITVSAIISTHLAEKLRVNFIIQIADKAFCKGEKTEYITSIQEDSSTVSNYMVSIPMLVCDSLLIIGSLIAISVQKPMIGSIWGILLLFVISWSILIRSKVSTLYQNYVKREDYYKEVFVDNLKKQHTYTYAKLFKSLLASVLAYKKYCWQGVGSKITFDVFFTLIIATFVLSELAFSNGDVEGFIRNLGYLALMNMVVIRFVDTFVNMIGVKISFDRVYGLIK